MEANPAMSVDEGVLLDAYLYVWPTANEVMMVVTFANGVPELHTHQLLLKSKSHEAGRVFTMCLLQ